MNALSEWPRNRLLLGLPSRDLRRLMPHLEHIPCHREQILVDADSPLDHIFFPDSSVVSVMAGFFLRGAALEGEGGGGGVAGLLGGFGAPQGPPHDMVSNPGRASRATTVGLDHTGPEY